MRKIYMLPRCEDVTTHDGDECGHPAAAVIEDDNDLDMHVCEEHAKQYLWDECKSEGQSARGVHRKGARIKLRVLDLT